MLHGWGQFSGQWDWDAPESARDEADLNEYRRAVGPKREPALISFYVAPIEAQVPGFLRKYAAFVKRRPFFVCSLALYYLDAPLHAQVESGAADPWLRTLFRGLKAAGRPVLLRPGYEFNQHDNPYDKTLYRSSFRRVARIAREEAPGLIATVWHAEPVGFADADFREWDPGDDAADWWGISLFFRETMTSTGTAAFMEEAARRGKPVLVAEASPWFHGDAERPVRGPESFEEAKRWYEGLFLFALRHPNVKALSPIVVDWSRWNSVFPQIPGGLPDIRLDAHRCLADWYVRRIAAPRFLHAAEAARLYVK